MNADADDSAGAGIQAEGFDDLLAIFVGLDIQKDLAGSWRNALQVLSNGLDIDNQCSGLSHAHSLQARADRSGLIGQVAVQIAGNGPRLESVKSVESVAYPPPTGVQWPQYP